MSNMFPNYSHTDNPEIFKNTYWGRGIVSNSSCFEIGKNRNKFVEIFGIKSSVEKYNQKILNFITELKQKYKNIDHIELYRDCWKRLVLVISPYHLDDDVRDKIMEEQGFNEFIPIYDPDATTLIKVF